ncbi:putative ADP,ATP carrier protein At5g56450 [Castanea sativa]|uniref:putative ADP,ATP carrier protein At5g56450 n=1 Tax=Castanea sativa TaxID=21020 RepID=UPI003F6541C2
MILLYPPNPNTYKWVFLFLNHQEITNQFSHHFLHFRTQYHDTVLGKKDKSFYTLVLGLKLKVFDIMTKEDEDDPENKRAVRSSSSTSYGPSDWLTSFHRDLMAGAVMGGMVHTIVAPIERAKLLLQTQESNLAIVGGTGRRRFKGMLDCIVRTVREEGIVSLWRGNGSSVIRHYPSVALNFSLKDLYKNILRSGHFEDGHFLSGPSANFIAGASAGCTTLILIYPLDIAHTRLAADVGRTEVRQFRGIYHFLTTIYEKDGIRGVYRGLPASLHGMVVHRGLYFGGFDTIIEMLSKESKPDLPLWKRWVVAQAVTTSAGLLSYPLDTVRRRMMMQSGLQQPMYNSTLDCWRKIYRREGLASFYRGALSNMFRSTGAAAVLVLYDEVKKFMNWGRL